MGAILSLNNSTTRESAPHEVSQSEMRKRQRLSSCPYEENPRLIPSLPDEISIQILARIPRIHYLKLKMVSRTWKTTIMTAELFNLRKELRKTEEWLYVLTKIESDKLIWYALDPLAGKWQRLPPMPSVCPEDESRRALTARRMWKMVGSSIRLADVIMGWLGRKDALDRMPFCGCSAGAVDGSLYVLGGFARATALACAWRYNPVINSWSESSPMSMGRAYSKIGILNNKLYVVGGVTRGRGGLAPLQSAEVFDPKTGVWSQIPSMPFTKAQVLPTAFLADLLKPIATGMTSYKGRLFVPQSLYCWPFFVDVGGEVYDPEVNSWGEMPTGMGEGWPARQAGTKMSVTVNGELYSLDPSSSLDSAKIKLYDYQDDTWKVVAEDVPLRDLTESESPYLLAGFLGKLHVITKDLNNNIAVLQAYVPNHLASISDNAYEISEGPAESEVDLWKVIATRSAYMAELVSCLVLDL